MDVLNDIFEKTALSLFPNLVRSIILTLFTLVLLLIIGMYTALIIYGIDSPIQFSY